MSVLFENGEVRLLAIGFVLVMLVTGAVWQFRLSRVFSFLSASRLFRQPLVGLVLTFGFAVVLFQSGATKMRRSGGLSVGAMNGLAPRATEVISIEVSAAEELFAWNTNAVTNICWQGIQTSSNMLWLAVAWPSNAVLPDSALDLYAVDDLARCKATNAWAWIGRVAVPGEATRAVFGINRSTLPWTVSDAAFFRFGLLTDSDLDGLTDAYEEIASGTNRLNADTDGDGMPDGFEVLYRLDPFADDAGGDNDADGLTNLEECRLGTNPANEDTDGDGLLDLTEIGRPVEELTQSPFASGSLVTNITDAAAFSETGQVDCVEVELPVPLELAGSTYARLALDPNGIVYLRTADSTNAIASAVFPEDYAQVLSRVNECVLMPYWSRLSRSTMGANVSDVRVERSNEVYLVTYENMRFDPAGAVDMVPAMLRPMVPMLVAMTPVSFQVEIDPAHGSVTYRYRLGSGSNPLADSMTTGRLAATGVQGRFMGMANECCFGDEGKLTSGGGLQFTMSTGTDPTSGDTDGDGMTDGTELNAGRDPNDVTDAGKADEASIFLAFGDPSLTRSESYQVVITPIVEAPVAHVPSVQSFLTNAGGLWRGRVLLEKGWRYEVRMLHRGTTLADGADYDYVLGFDSLSSLVEISDPNGLRGCNVFVDKTTNYAADGKVAVIAVYDVDAMICSPEDWSELDETRVVLDNEEFRAKFTIRPQVDSLEEVIRVFGESFTVTSSGTAPTGVQMPLTGAEILNVNIGSEVRVSMAWLDLRNYGVLPLQDDDGVNEMAWLDTASRTDPKQNLEDSEAFAGIGYEDRGTASNYDPARTLYSSPPNSYPSKSYFKAAGREIVTVSYGGAESQRGQIMNQADYFYYSGHGTHDTGALDSGRFTPDMARGLWNRDLGCVVFSACSVLDINDYNGQFSGVSHALSPGRQWETVGPTNLLGYCAVAPSDKSGVTTKVMRNWLAKRGTMSDVDAWMEANRAARAWSACAIVKNVKYVYFFRISKGFYFRKEVLKEK